ncbi:EAL and HDOD domain-containing protein [Halanaerobacter jeridensis]|uniref:EAL and modified HD-GYP domain-containing signal transduction protein n=1 Tax=Halanaerobacter jeridensis TaxID=706427 RepID=A0A938XTI5_9FIRM|nr:HDOD domain-containing protein [Halanaerobacter jeridensis]MBM7556609.1 EAL and modified HD-GYP domain-containing signal transduction protein [Halanaerobacter jeridensis]
MDVFVARQPIFDINKNVYGYELLYRDGIDNYYKHIDGDVATSEVLNSSFFLIGLKSLTNCKRAFINFTTNLIQSEVPTIFDNQLIVIEILEDINLNFEIINSCQKLKEEGYMIALDDFIFKPKYLSLLDLADMIKVDFLATTRKEREQIANIALAKGISILAEKVETQEEFEEAVELGFSYFQGYFFSKPVVMSGKDLPISPSNYFRILEELHIAEPDLDKVAVILERDLSLSYKLLKLINSAAFPIRGRIDSIKKAVTMLGIDEFEKWINLIILKELCEQKPKEIIRLSIIRAKFSELIAQEIGREDKSKFFMMGMFSLLDVLMNDRFENLLSELPIPEEIKSALLKEDGIFANVLKLVLAYEKAEWQKLSQNARELEIEEDKIANFYQKSIEWCNNVLAHTA